MRNDNVYCSNELPAPPFTVRDQEHLVQLLLEGSTGPREPVTEDEWTQLRQELRARLAPQGVTISG